MVNAQTDDGLQTSAHNIASGQENRLLRIFAAQLEQAAPKVSPLADRWALLPNWDLKLTETSLSLGFCSLNLVRWAGDVTVEYHAVKNI